MAKYDHQAIEAKWQRVWEERRTFRAPGPGDDGFDAERPKAYILDMFPYPSGKGLHVGHPFGYIGTDILSRYKRMTGHNVLHPMGADAFGLPAEQYAVETGVHPRATTDANVEVFKRQLKTLGLSYDFDRWLATTDPEYYRWTQWTFLKLFDSWYDPVADKARPISELEAQLDDGEMSADERRRYLDDHRLAYLAEVEVNWCPQLGTVLANEEVTNEGRSDRGDFPVFRRPLKQWMLRITAYADRLIEELDLVNWPESIRTMQRNWIGRSDGADVSFAVEGSDDEILVYTTRPDTLWGASYMVLAPEHSLVDVVTTLEHKETVAAYRDEAARKTELARTAETKEKTGVFTGGHAINPVNGERIPIWVADYVLMGYGTGAIMAVPAGDERDFEFAQEFGLPINTVVTPPDEWLQRMAPHVDADGLDALRDLHRRHPAQFPEAFTGYGIGVNSSNDEVSLDGLPSAEAIATVVAWLESVGRGAGRTRYKLRDWLFSRQRYWGEPIPILHGPNGELRPVPDGELPLLLPELDDFRPHASDDPDAEPIPALGRAPDEWQHVDVEGVTYRRELNTMPQWAGSQSYYLRYIDPRNDQALVDPEKERYWMAPDGVDLYVGGVEHGVLHLLYARFWHKVLFDLGYVSTPEPFGHLFNQGYILAAAFQDERGIYAPADEVTERDGSYFHPTQGEVVRSWGKMGKSLKNSISADKILAEYGADTLRLHEMYMGPLGDSKPWSTQDIVGVHRFLQRAWRNFVDDETGDLILDEEEPPDEELARLLHRTIAQVTDDVEGLRFNTALARLIELNNTLVGRDRVPREVAEPFVLMVAPYAPHFCEELWERFGHGESIAHAPWPSYDESYLVTEQVEIVVQVNGKVRARVQAAPGTSEADLEAAARADDRITALLEGSTVRKVVVVPDRLVNFVVA